MLFFLGFGFWEEGELVRSRSRGREEVASEKTGNFSGASTPLVLSAESTGSVVSRRSRDGRTTTSCGKLSLVFPGGSVARRRAGIRAGSSRFLCGFPTPGMKFNGSKGARLLIVSK